MKIPHGFAAAACILAASCMNAAAGAPLETRVGTDHADALYRCGEPAEFTVSVLDGTTLVRTGAVDIVLDDFGTNVFARKSFSLEHGNPFAVRGTLHAPGFLRISVSGPGDGRKVWSAGYEPERIRAATGVPRDFDAFWSAARRRLAAEVPLDARISKVPERSTGRFDFYRISFASFGRRVHGYMSVPADSSLAPFPLELQISAAGFGDWTNNMSGEPDRICVFFGVYPFEPDWRWRTSGLKEKYTGMDGALRRRYSCGSYATAGAGVSCEEYFFYPVILGIDRAVDWLAARPDVDRARIVCKGESQGAGLGMALTALNRNIRRATFAVPALTDTLAGDAGRQSGWPRPVESLVNSGDRDVARHVMPYFDAVCFASRITCPVRFAVGFSDTTCPPHCIYAAFNAVASCGARLLGPYLRCPARVEARGREVLFPALAPMSGG